MAVITIGGGTWSNGDQLTPAALNLKWSSATFASGAVDATTVTLSGGKIAVATGGVDTAQLAAGAVDGTKIAADAVDNEHYVDESIDTAHLSADCVTEAKIADDAVESEHFNDNVISGQTELETAPADADELLISDAGTIKKVGWDTILKHPAIPKAYGVVTFDTGTPALSEAYACTLNSEDTSSRTIDLTNAMDTAVYTVLTTWGSTGDVNVHSPTVVINSASQFTLYVGSDVETANLVIHFAVFGTPPTS